MTRRHTDRGRARELPFTPQGLADLQRLYSETDFLPGTVDRRAPRAAAANVVPRLPAQNRRRRRRNDHAAEEHSESVLGSQLRRAVGARRLSARTTRLHRTAVRRGRRSVSGRRAVHLSLSRRQRERCAAAGAQADSGRRARQHDGRHRHRAFRLRTSRRDGVAGTHPPQQHRAARATRRRRRDGDVRARRRARTRARTAMRARVLQRDDSVSAAGAAPKSNAARSPKRFARRWSTRTWCCATGNRSSRPAFDRFYSPTGYYAYGMLDFPVSLGAYQFPRSPDDPIVVHMSRAPVPGDGSRDVDQFRAGRYELLGTTFEEMERETRRQLTDMLGGYGFDPARDIVRLDHQPLAARLRARIQRVVRSSRPRSRRHSGFAHANRSAAVSIAMLGRAG